MPKKQTRRSVSLKGTTYDRLLAHCQAGGRSVSDQLEELVAVLLDAAPTVEVAVTVDATRPPPSVPRLKAEIVTPAQRRVRAPEPAPRKYVSIAEGRAARVAIPEGRDEAEKARPAPSRPVPARVIPDPWSRP